MAIGVPVPLGTSIPQRKHAISVQLPAWKDVVGIGNGDIKTLKALRNGYPRSNLHIDVQMLVLRCKEKVTSSSHHDFGLSLFPDSISAEVCVAYIISNKEGGKVAPARDVRKLQATFDRALISDHESQQQLLAPLWVVVYPDYAKSSAASFWRLTGMGISSRMAETYLRHADLINFSENPSPYGLCYRCPGTPVYGKLRERIAGILGRATIVPASSTSVIPSDVFLFPSGMSTIYHVQRMLLQWRNAGSVVLGFPYELTLKILETYGPSCKFFSSGEDIDALEKYLGQMAPSETGYNKVQAIWCECPSNPLLCTPDLQRVRRLADEYGVAVIVDDTISSSANVDVLNVADVVVTSLTKSFNGYADVLAGCAILNPNSRYHQELKSILNGSYVNTFYIGDATRLEINSRSYLERVAATNETAEYLVDHLRPLTSGSAKGHGMTDKMWCPTSQIIREIYYPKGSPSMGNYIQQMRHPTDGFEPGYGCLFTIDFETVIAAAKFFDNLDLHKGPSLGADITLVLPYVQLVLQQQKEWAASHGLRETIVRISVGLEDKHDLLVRLRRALSIASS